MPTDPGVRYLGLQPHAEAITTALCGPDGHPRFLATIPNRQEAVRQLLRRLEPVATLRACCEAGPAGYGLYWQLVSLGVRCEVVARERVPLPGETAASPGRSALELAARYRRGDLQPEWLPQSAQRALRKLVRDRTAPLTLR